MVGHLAERGLLYTAIQRACIQHACICVEACYLPYLPPLALVKFTQSRAAPSNMKHDVSYRAGTSGIGIQHSVLCVCFNTFASCTHAHRLAAAETKIADLESQLGELKKQLADKTTQLEKAQAETTRLKGDLTVALQKKGCMGR